MINLQNLTTEKRNEKTMNLDTLSIDEAMRIMNEEDQNVALAVREVLPQIKPIIEETIKSFNKNGRLFYIGAGTSGRLGILDASECVPTFGVSPSMVQGIIAGGKKAMTVAVEGAEDSLTLGKDDLEKANLTNNDIVVGIAASGRTPYVIGALEYANKIGATTATISCNKNAEISKYATYPVEVDAGAEFLTGSTRLKAGTTQKLILNMISTISMIGIGKVYKNLMVDVQPTNSKLIERSKRIIMEATSCDYETAQSYLDIGGDVKTAIVMILTGMSKDDAIKKLSNSKGFIREAIK